MVAKRRTINLAIVVIAAAVAPLLWSTPAAAGTVSLTLVQHTLDNVPDAAGGWQHEGGTIVRAGVAVGQYAIHRRITTSATHAQNTAMVTITLFFSSTGSPPQNVTLQGAHSFASGRFVGSVAAASNRYTWVIGADAVIAPTTAVDRYTLTITWTGATQLRLP